jgi:hypothetical protein
MDTTHNIYHDELVSETTGTTIMKNVMVMVALFSLIFIVAKIFGLEKAIWLRYINYLLFFPFAYSAIKKKYKINEKLNYFAGLKTGFLTCFFGQLIYTILFFIYLHFDEPLLMYITGVMPNGLINPVLSISFMLFSEGLAWALITTLAVMQIFKWKRGRWAVHS